MKRQTLSKIEHWNPDDMLSLFAGVTPRQLHIDAVLRGCAHGTVYVDASVRPSAGCILAGDACYVAGRPLDGRFYDAVNALLPRDRYTAVFVAREIPAESVERLLDGLYMIPATRRVAFLGRSPDVRWSLPDRVRVEEVDEALLAADGEGIDVVRDGILEEWETVEEFLRTGWGAVALSDGRVIAHSITDYVSSGTCEMSIHVDAEHRRRHTGTAVAGKVAGEALARGMTQVVWHSWANNAGSVGVSRNIGFGDGVFYTVYVNHWAAENITDLSQDEFRAFGEEYERLFSECPPSETGYPYVVAATAWACAQDRARCLTNLYRAIDMGWLTSIGQLRGLWPELFLDPDLPERVPEWGTLFARLALHEE